MASNDNDKRKMEEEAESSMMRKRLWHIDNDGDDNDSSESSNSLEEEPEEVSLEETSMNQLDISEEKLHARRAHDILFKDDGDTTSTLSESLPTPKSHRCSDDDDDDFWM
jgi:hypothetical protein